MTITLYPPVSGGGGAEVNDLSSVVTWANVPDANVTASSVTQHEAVIDHDLLSNFTAAEHIDWTGDAGADNIHVNNITSVPEAVVTTHEAAIDHDLLSNFLAAEHVDWTGDAGASNIHVNNITAVPEAAVTAHEAALTLSTAQVTAAGALMDSEVDADLKTLALPASTTISAFGATVIDDANQGAAQTTLGVDPAGTDNSTLEYMYPIWAEENAALGNSTYEWAFGNGANTPSDTGIAIYVPSGWTATIVAMSATTNNASGSSVIEADINGTLQGANCNVTLAGRSATNDSFTPVSLSDGDRLTFRTTTAGTNTSPSTVCAWVKMVET